MLHGNFGWVYSRLLFLGVIRRNPVKFFSCTDTSNNLLTGELADLSSSSNVKLMCIFLSGFTGSAHCTVQYGTDPTYMNLPYSAESTETGTAGDTVSVVLRERLNSSTVYYYTVSAVSGDVRVIVQGNFTTPQCSKFLYVLGLKPSYSIAMINPLTTDDAFWHHQVLATCYQLMQSILKIGSALAERVG